MSKINKITTEYYTVAMSEKLKEMVSEYRKIDPILSTLDDRKIMLYIVNQAIEQEVEISTEMVSLSRVKDIKLRKTKKIEAHFDNINKNYKKFGVDISSRQYFHRLILGYLTKTLA